MAKNRVKIAILASGNGTNAQAIIDGINQGWLQAEIRLVISNNPAAGVLERAVLANIPNMVLDHHVYGTREGHDAAILAALEESGCDLVILAGYMRLLSKAILERFSQRILNIHPAILPSFPGTHGVVDALAYGVKITGATVHFVEEIMDSGPVVIQGAFSVAENESEQEIFAKMHALEHEIYPQAIQWVAEKRLALHGRKVIIKEDKTRPKRYLPGLLISPPLEIRN